MARYTTAYSKFVFNLKEVQALHKFAKEQADGESMFNGSAAVRGALCRSAIVLLSSHVEGYIENLADIILYKIVEKRIRKTKLSPQFLYFLSKDLLDKICDTENPEGAAKKVQELFSRDYHIWDDSDYFGEDLQIDLFVSGFSNPKFVRIKRFFARFGYEDYSRDLGHNLKSNYKLCKNMVDNVVDQRNKIAHGDVTSTSTPRDLADMLELIQLYCRSTDEVIGGWFSKLGCPIR